MAQLFCAIVGKESVFSVRVDESDFVDDLKKAIKDENRATITCDAKDLQLFLAKTVSGAWLGLDEAGAASVDLDQDGDAQHSNTKLVKLKSLQRLENCVGQLPGQDQVHVLVVVPKPPKPRWKATVAPVYALNNGSLYFVNREQAVAELCQVHREVYLGATNKARADDWPIALADNELGLGKSQFGKHYIRRCIEQWPEGVPADEGFQESLRAAQTIVVDVQKAVFARALIESYPEEYTLQKVMNDAFAKAVIDQLDLSNGAQMPSYLTSEEALAKTDIVANVVSDFGPVFIVLDEIGRGFELNKFDEEKARYLFFTFCSTVLQAWMSTKGAYFVLLGYAPFLRNVEEYNPTSSKYRFIRLKLQLIRPNKIEDIIRKTKIDKSELETLQQRWGLTSDEAVEKSAVEVYRKTCGHPRTMIRMFKAHPSYQEFCTAEVKSFGSQDADKEWAKVSRELRFWKPVLEKLLKTILSGENKNLSEDFSWPANNTEGKTVSYARVMERCHIGWEGTVTEAKLYALPRILAEIAGIIHPLRDYIKTIDSIVDKITLPYANTLEWALLKRFQELFSEPRRPSSVLSSFFGEDTVFGKLENVQFPIDNAALPKITRRKTNLDSPTLDSATANPSEWPKLMAEIATKLVSSAENGLCLKPLSESSSADVLFMQHFVEVETVGTKRRRNKVQTLTLGLAVKNYKGKNRIGSTDLDKECAKFNAMFSNLKESTKTKFGAMVNVLFVCSTNYAQGLMATFNNNKYAVYQQKDVTGSRIDEVVLLDLSTPENRTEFFGLSGNLGNDGLAITLNKLINKTERERTAEEI